MNAPTDDREAIARSVTDYFEAWFDGDADRMRSCLHTRLAKRRPPGDGETDLLEITYERMIAGLSRGPLTGLDRRITVTVLDVAGDIATAKVHSKPFDEYIHLVCTDGRWLIVNALYRRRPAST